MTARVTTLKGPGAGEYYVQALPSYYLDAGEPKGVWHGRGAVVLGLDGELVDGEFLKLMAGNHPRMRADVPLGRMYGEESVRGFDITASAPKSVSTMFALGDDTTRGQVLEAHDTAVATMLEWGRNPRAHPLPHRRPGRGRRRGRDRGGDIPATHFTLTRPAASYSCGHREPGPF